MPKKQKRLGNIQRNVEFIRENDYNGNKEWRKYVGLIKTRVVLKFFYVNPLMTSSVAINKNKSCIEIGLKLGIAKAGKAD